MTQQGVMGMKTGNVGPGRQIYDKSYYMHTLRTKRDELQFEINRFRKEIDEIQTDNNLYSTYEKRYDQLIKQVRHLEGDLADYNLALDKQRTDTRPEEVQGMFDALKAQNDQQRGDLDAIFLEKKNHEEEIRKIEEEIGMIRKGAEDRLNELPLDSREEYESLQEENNRLQHDLGHYRMELERVNVRLTTAEGRLRSDVMRMRAQQQRETLHALREQHEKLQEEAEQLQLSVPEQRDLLLAKVKSENVNIMQFETKAHEVRDEITRYRKQTQEMQTDIEERKGETSDKHKYEILFSKDQEMSNFIETFDEAKREEEGQLKAKQESILGLLTAMSKVISRERNMPEAKAVRDLEDQLEFKGKELANSEITQVRLKAELERRSGELEKINSLDNKISGELSSLEVKMRQMQQDIAGRYNHVDAVKQQGSQVVEALEVKREQMAQLIGSLKQMGQHYQLEHEALKQQLLDNEQHTALEQQETKLRSTTKAVHYLKTFIQARRAESDYDPIVKQTFDLVEQVNQHLQRACSQAAYGSMHPL